MRLWGRMCWLYKQILERCISGVYHTSDKLVVIMTG